MILGMKRFLIPAALSVLLVASCAVPDTPAATDSPNASTAATGEKDNTNRPLALLETLTVAPELSPDYDRDDFAGWLHSDEPSCDTRDEILLRDAQTAPSIGPDCELTGGAWVSSYDQLRFTDSSELDIDHIVSLLEHEESQAPDASPLADSDEQSKRDQFSNDPANLIAVSASSNRSKGSKDISEWMPVNEEIWCEYATSWVQVKADYQLTVDPDEYAALHDILTTC